jgi:lipoate synthase
MGLKHAVITSVNRDELADGGASVFAATICEIRDQVPGCAVEVLTPDFKGDRHAIRTDCNRAAMGRYAADGSVRPNRRKPPKQAQFPDALKS